MQDFQFDIEYRKGKSIEHVDYLSRNPPKDYRVNVAQIDKKIISTDSWLEIAQRKDDETQALIQRVETGDTVCSDYHMVNGLLGHKVCSGKGNILTRFYIPKGYRIALLRLYHYENCHLGQ